MEIPGEKVGRCVVLRPEGRIDSDNAQAFEERLLAEVAANPGNVVVNLAGTTYLSSKALRALVTALKAARGRTLRKGKVVLAAVPPNLREVFDLATLNMLFEFYDDEQSAVDSF